MRAGTRVPEPAPLRAVVQQRRKRGAAVPSGSLARSWRTASVIPAIPPRGPELAIPRGPCSEFLCRSPYLPQSPQKPHSSPRSPAPQRWIAYMFGFCGVIAPEDPNIYEIAACQVPQTRHLALCRAGLRAADVSRHARSWRAPAWRGANAASVAFGTAAAREVVALCHERVGDLVIRSTTPAHDANQVSERYAVREKNDGDGHGWFVLLLAVFAGIPVARSAGRERPILG